MPGQLYHEDLDAQTYADWGIDYLKSDNCATYGIDSSVRFGAMRGALNRTGRPIVLSTEPFSINPDPEQSMKVANLWRTGCDIAATGRTSSTARILRTSGRRSPALAAGTVRDSSHRLARRHAASRGSHSSWGPDTRFWFVVWAQIRT